jgi:hypothetical protein
MPGQVIALSADHRLEAFAVGDDRNLWHIWQTSQNNGWSNWANHRTPEGIRFESPPAVVLNTDLRQELFIIGNDGHVCHIWQNARNGPWSNWWVHDGPPNGVQGAPAVGINQDGRLEVFVVERGSHWLYSQPQTSASNGWTPNWFGFGAPPNVRLASSPAVGRNADGHLEVFVVGSDGMLWEKYQTAPNNGWSDWKFFGAPPGVRWTISSPVVASNADGRLELFMVGSDNHLWHEWQTAPNNGWSGGWQSLWAPNGRPIAGTPAVGSNADGRLEVFVVAYDGTWWHCWQIAPNSAWSAWDDSLNVRGGHGSLAVGSNDDFRLEVFGSNGDLVHTWQDWGSDTRWWKGPVDDGPLGIGPPLPIGLPPATLGSPTPGVRLIPWNWPVLSV